MNRQSALSYYHRGKFQRNSLSTAQMLLQQKNMCDGFGNLLLKNPDACV